MCLGTLGIEPNGLREVRNRLVELALSVIDMARARYGLAYWGLSRMTSV